MYHCLLLVSIHVHVSFFCPRHLHVEYTLGLECYDDTRNAPVGDGIAVFCVHLYLSLTNHVVTAFAALPDSTRCWQFIARKSMAAALAGITYSATTDIWTAPNKNSFISLVVSYIDRKPGAWKLITMDLECSPFNESHTGDNIAAKLLDLIDGCGLDKTRCMAMTTDNASNMIKAGATPGAPPREACAVHTLELTVKRLVGDMAVKGLASVGANDPDAAFIRGFLSEGPGELQRVLKICSEVQSFFSRSVKVSLSVVVSERYVGCNQAVSLSDVCRLWTPPPALLLPLVFFF